MILDALKKHEKGRLRHLNNDRCEKVVLALFEEAQERTEGIFCNHIFETWYEPPAKLSPQEE